MDFGASDAPMTDAELSQAKGGPVMHIPTVVGVVVVTYNLSGLTQPLRLDGPTVANIFLGKIAKWNDPRIAALNPGVTLPATDILVVHRSDGKRHDVHVHRLPGAREPGVEVGPGCGKGAAVAGRARRQGQRRRRPAQIKSTAGAVGYVELAYVKQNNLTAALLKNAAGQFVAPAASAATAAADAAVAKLAAEHATTACRS